MGTIPSTVRDTLVMIVARTTLYCIIHFFHLCEDPSAKIVDLPPYDIQGKGIASSIKSPLSLSFSLSQQRARNARLSCG